MNILNTDFNALLIETYMLFGNDAIEYDFLYALSLIEDDIQKFIDLKKLSEKISNKEAIILEDHIINNVVDNSNIVNTMIRENKLLKAFFDKMSEIPGEHGLMVKFVLFILDKTSDIIKDTSKFIEVIKDKFSTIESLRDYMESSKDVHRVRTEIGRVAVDLAEEKFFPVYFRDEEIKLITSILLRNRKNNVVLLGEAGVGKTAVAHLFAKKLANNEIPFFEDKKLWKIDPSVMSPDMVLEVAATIRKIIDIGDFVYIDEFHSLFSYDNIKQPIIYTIKDLAARKAGIIVSTTLDEYNSIILNDTAFKRRFHVIHVNEFSPKEVLSILDKLTKWYKLNNSIEFTEEALNYIVYLTHKFVPYAHMPDKAIDLIEDILSSIYIDQMSESFDSIIKLMRDKYPAIKVTKERVIEVFEKTYNVNVAEFNINKVDKKLLKLAKFLESLESIESIFDEDQNRNILILTDSTQKLQNDISSLASSLIKQKLYQHMIVISPASFPDEHYVATLIGSPPGYVGYSDNSILDSLFTKPRTVILVDLDGLPSKVRKFVTDIASRREVDTPKGKLTLPSAVFIFMKGISEGEKVVGFESKPSDIPEVDKDIDSIVAKTLTITYNVKEET